MKHIDKEFQSIIDSIQLYIRSEKEWGIQTYLSETELAAGEREPGRHTSSDEWTELEKEISGCARCDLHKTRRNTVVGSGSRKARLVFVGEAPGREEDIQGKPFVGRAGGLLTKIIEAMHLSRDDVYIANILKCRPPNNRSPLPTEILACQDNIRRQLELIGPGVICTLGKFASQTLLKTTVPITKLRGHFYDYRGIKVMPTYHPAYLLRNPRDKRLVWQDMKKIMKELAL